MTGLRERLVEALGKHFISKGHENHGRGERVYVASPMVDVNDLADVLLSLPGVSVVELPNGKGIAEHHIEYGRGGNCEHGCCPPWVRDADADIDFGVVDEARAYAAALLAAANAAEQAPK